MKNFLELRIFFVACMMSKMVKESNFLQVRVAYGPEAQRRKSVNGLGRTQEGQVGRDCKTEWQEGD